MTLRVGSVVCGDGDTAVEGLGTASGAPLAGGAAVPRCRGLLCERRGRVPARGSGAPVHLLCPALVKGAQNRRPHRRGPMEPPPPARVS